MPFFNNTLHRKIKLQLLNNEENIIDKILSKINLFCESEILMENGYDIFDQPLHYANFPNSNKYGFGELTVTMVDACLTNYFEKGLQYTLIHVDNAGRWTEILYLSPNDGQIWYILTTVDLSEIHDICRGPIINMDIMEVENQSYGI